MLRLARGWEGGRKETSECLKLQKDRCFFETSEADLSPSIALGVTPAKRLNFRVVQERLPDRRTSAPAYQQSFSHLDNLGVCDSGHG